MGIERAQHMLKTNPKGLTGVFWDFWQYRDFKAGTEVGKDDYGNTYYEDNSMPLGRNRYVRYKDPSWGFDGTEIPAEWHSWVHNMTDVKGSDLPKPKFVTRHVN